MGKIMENRLDAATAKRKRGRRVATPAVNSKAERQVFARNLRRFRIEANLSQRELGETTRTGQAYISQIELALQNISVEKMVILAQALRKPLYEMLIP